MTKRNAKQLPGSIGLTGVVGGTIGAFLWMEVLGLVIGSSVLIVLAPVLFFGTVAGLIRLFRAFPARHQLWTGGLMLWVVLVNAIVVNLYWERIPELAFGLRTGRSDPGYVGVHLTFAGLGVAGVWFVVKGMFSSKAGATRRRAR